jgi:hypothetical protein
MSPPLTIYAEKTPLGGVNIFRDKEKTSFFCSWGSWKKNKPTRRNKWLTLDCYKWRLEWL